jgi:hypothetical protein
MRGSHVVPLGRRAAIGFSAIRLLVTGAFVVRNVWTAPVLAMRGS